MLYSPVVKMIRVYFSRATSISSDRICFAPVHHQFGYPLLEARFKPRSIVVQALLIQARYVGCDLEFDRLPGTSTRTIPESLRLSRETGVNHYQTEEKRPHIIS